MKKIHKLVMASTMIAAVSLTVVGYTAVAAKGTASVVRGQYDFSDMTVRRVWFNTLDPVFMIDDYDRVWLDPCSLPWRKCSGRLVPITGRTVIRSPLS